MRNKKNLFRLGVVSLALAALLTACGGGSSSAPASSAEPAAESAVSASSVAEAESAAASSAVSEAASEPAESSPLDGISFTVSKVRNDVTGNWRISSIAENIDMSEYALDYYRQYFTDDSEIHFIVNFNTNTTTKIMCVGSDLDVTVQDYVSKEEHDVKLLGSGAVQAEYFVDKETGEAEKVR